MLQIYLDPPTSNSRKALAGLALLGTEYKLNRIDHVAGEHRRDEFKKINPHATLPTAVDDELVIPESNAILQYAADRDGGHPAYPKDLKKRASVNRWLFWEASAWFPCCYAHLVEYVVKPLYKAEPDQARMDVESPRWLQLATILDNHLSGSKWLIGDELTIADISVASAMHAHEAQRLPLDQTPNLKRWIGDIEQLDCWKQTQGAVDSTLLREFLAAKEAKKSSDLGDGPKAS